MRPLALLLLLTANALATAAAGQTLDPEIHWSPAENLERIDVRVLGTATRTIDMAAYVLTDYAVIGALRQAAARGVAVRIYRSRDEDGFAPSPAYRALVATTGVTIRVKPSRVYMHLKSYAIDGRLLRTGAANFSDSGLKRQDNDLVLTREPTAVAGFEATFAAMWAVGEPERPEAKQP